jgi:hypothetical protein
MQWMNTPHPPHTRHSDLPRKRGGAGHAPRDAFFWAALVVLAGAVFAGVWASIRTMERRALAAVLLQDHLTHAGDMRPIADVAAAIRSMQLVTVEIHTRVTAMVEHDSWRGDVAARVEAPARLLYGADLSGLESSRVSLSPLGGAYIVRIPLPMRIATEVCAQDEEIDVQVGWLRLRSRAGEFYLGLARRNLHERARELALSPEQAMMVRETTRRQVEALVRRIVGPRTVVTVIFDEGGS